MGTVNYIKGLYGPVRVSYPLAFSPSGIIDPTTGHALSAYAVIGGAGYSTTYPETSSLASARFIEWNLKTTNTGSGEVYGEYMSLQSGGTGTGYVYTKGALAKSVTGGYVAELGACYYKTQLSAGTVTGQNYVGFFEYVVDTGVANMPSGGCIQLDDIVDGSLNAVHGYIAIRTYGGTPFSNLFNIMDHTSGTGKLFYGSTLKIRIGSTQYYIPLSTAENTFTFTGVQAFTGNVTFGTDATGVDVRFNGANAGRYMLWDANGDTDGAFFFGASAEGIQTTWYGDVAGYLVRWDPTTDTNGEWDFGASTKGVKVVFNGAVASYSVSFDPDGDTNGAWYFGADTKGIMVNLYGDTTGCGVFWDPTTDTNGTLSIGASGGSKGNDVFMYGATNGNYLQWDQSADDLLLVGTATQLAVAGTTASSSSTTGSLRTAGGLGVAGAAYIGGLLNVAGALTVSVATESTSTTTGALIVTGGIGFAGDMYVGDDVFLTSGAVLNFAAGDVTLTHSTGVLAITPKLTVTGTGDYTSPAFSVTRTFVTSDFDQTYHAAARVNLDLTNDVPVAKYASAFNIRIIGAADVASGGQLYGLWVDSAGTAAAIGGDFYMARYSVQAGAAIPTAYMQFQTADPGVTYAFAFVNNDGVGPCKAGGTGSTYTIAVRTPDGNPGYIRVFAAV